MTPSFDPLPLLAAALAWLAAASDLRTGRIPNRLVLFFALAIVCLRGLGVAMAWVTPSMLLHETLYGALFAACVPLLLYVCGGLGAGDLKLLVVCGAALGPLAALHLELYAFVLGASFALLRLTYRGALLHTLWRSVRALCDRRQAQRAGRAASQETRQAVRFAPAVALASLLVLVERWH